MASSIEQYDNVLLGILQKEGKIGPFLEAIFNFLYRRTDFYRILQEPNGKMGFPEGAAEKYVLQAFKKYQQYAMQDEEKRQKQLRENINTSENSVPDVANIVEVESENDQPATERSSDGKEGDNVDDRKTSADPKYEQPITCQKKATDTRSTSEGYNGAILDNYSWSQSVNDIDVHVKVPEYVVKAKFVRVHLENSSLRVDIRCDSGQWKTVLGGELMWKINKEQSMWTLVPGEHVHVNFEKLEERWWDALLVDEPKIDMQAIEPIKNMDDLPEDEKAKIDELLFNERQKLLNKPTIEQMKIQNILKEAWDIEGSPFKGQPFDPSIVNITGTTDSLCGLDQPLS